MDTKTETAIKRTKLLLQKSDALQEEIGKLVSFIEKQPDLKQVNITLKFETLLNHRIDMSLGLLSLPAFDKKVFQDDLRWVLHRANWRIQSRIDELKKEQEKLWAKDSVS
jgi:hypothetical protein